MGFHAPLGMVTLKAACHSRKFDEDDKFLRECESRVHWFGLNIVHGFLRGGMDNEAETRLANQATQFRSPLALVETQQH